MSERLNDMLDRYGEVCPQKKAAQILSVTPRTIARMMDDGRLRRVGMHVDVRSIMRAMVLGVTLRICAAFFCGQTSP